MSCDQSSVGWGAMRILSARGAAAALLLLLAAPLGGCGSFLTESTATGAGIAGAGIAGAISKDATVGAAIGLGVAAGANAGLLYVEREIHHNTQTSIADAAGKLSEGDVAQWHSTHVVPIELDQHGQVAVSRQIQGPDFFCKEIVFSVDHGADEERAFFTAYICRDGERWRWATAEPATARWGSLQ
jgi:hypothetical protein